MGQGTEHSFHQHNRSTISGTYYVQTPRKCSSLLFEDPRLDRTMVQTSGFSMFFLEVWKVQEDSDPVNKCGANDSTLVIFDVWIILDNIFAHLKDQHEGSAGRWRSNRGGWSNVLRSPALWYCLKAGSGIRCLPMRVMTSESVWVSIITGVMKNPPLRTLSNEKRAVCPGREVFQVFTSSYISFHHFFQTANMVTEVMHSSARSQAT